MKRQFVIIAAAVAALFAVSCVKETPVETPNTDAPAEVAMREVTITASIDPETKTSYDADGKFSWTVGDQISVLGADGKFYTFTAKESGAVASFTGSLPEGCALGDFALYPAEEGHTYDVNDYYPYRFVIPTNKDLTQSPSAYLPLHGEKGGDDSFAFKHMTGGFKFTINNFDDIFKTAEVSIVTTELKISGSYQVRKSSTYGGYITYAEATSEADELSFVRKVNVVDNSAEVYFPYSPGNDLWGTTTITVVGYDDNNVPARLLSQSASFGGLAHARATIIPVAPLALPEYVPEVDLGSVNWDAENVAVFANDATSADGSVMKEIRAFADNDNLYVRVTATSELNGANYLDVSFCDGEGTTAVWWGWTTTGTTPYWKEHKGTIDASGTLTSMQYSHNGSYQTISTSTEISENEIIWYLTYPREYVNVYKNSKGTAFVSSLLWKNYDGYWAAPARGNNMLEVTLP